MDRREKMIYVVKGSQQEEENPPVSTSTGKKMKISSHDKKREKYDKYDTNERYERQDKHSRHEKYDDYDKRDKHEKRDRRDRHEKDDRREKHDKYDSKAPTIAKNIKIEPHLHLLQKYSHYNWEMLDINELYVEFKELEKNLKAMLDVILIFFLYYHVY